MYLHCTDKTNLIQQMILLYNTKTQRCPLPLVTLPCQQLRTALGGLIMFSSDWQIGCSSLFLMKKKQTDPIFVLGTLFGWLVSYCCWLKELHNVKKREK